MKLMPKILLYLLMFTLAFASPFAYEIFVKKNTLNNIYFPNQKNQPQTNPLNTPEEENEQFLQNAQDGSFSQKNSADIPKNQNTSIDETDDENLSMESSKNIPLLTPQMSQEKIHAECLKLYKDYDNQNRFQWAKSHTVRLFIAKSIIKVTVDKSIWNDLDIADQKLITQDLFYCSRDQFNHRYKLIQILDAENNTAILSFSPKINFHFWKQDADFTADDSLD